MLRLVAALAAFVVGACECGPETVEPPRQACAFNSDCGPGSHCADDGFCVAGLEPGTCLADTDCGAGFLCVKPDGSDVGACFDQNECAVDGDCDEGQVCVVDEDTGYRVCIFEGCETDDECTAEVGASCTVNEEPKCVARACRCQDYCGAPCGDGRQCCALPGEAVACIDDPGPCADLPCDPGFAGGTDDPGAWVSPQCGYPDATCTCRELPPLPLGDVGSPQVLVAHAGARFVVSYAREYGDVVVAPASTSPVGPWAFVAGVPAGAPVVAGPSGPRGGVAEPGDDVGRMLDAAFGPDGVLHVVARDDTNRALLLLSGPPQGPMTAEVLDDVDDPGWWPTIAIDDQGRLLVAHVAARTAAGDTEVRLLAQPTVGAAPAAWHRQTLRTRSLATVDCEGGCADGAVCVAPAVEGELSTCEPAGTSCSCDPDEVCTAGGCVAEGVTAAIDDALALDRLTLAGATTGFALFGHDARGTSLVGIRHSGGDPYAGTGTFLTATILNDGDVDLGHDPAAARTATGFLVAAVDEATRAVVLATLNGSLVVQGTPAVVDDGLRPHPSGAIDDHAVDLPAIALRADDTGVIAWLDGTDGSLRARDVLAGGALGPAQLLAGGRLAEVYAGSYVLGAAAHADATGVAITAKRALLDTDPATFDVVVVGGPLGCPADDPQEPDDAIGEATLLASGDVASGIVCGPDDDYFSVPVAAGCTITATLYFRDVDGDLDVRVLDADGAQLAASTGVDDEEVAAATFPAAGTAFVRVHGFNFDVDVDQNAYVLRADVACP